MDYFLIEDHELLKKCNTNCNKVSSETKKEFHSKPVYNKTFLKTKLNSFGDEATDFHDKEMTKGGSNDTCLAV